MGEPHAYIYIYIYLMQVKTFYQILTNLNANITKSKVGDIHYNGYTVQMTLSLIVVLRASTAFWILFLQEKDVMSQRRFPCEYICYGFMFEDRYNMVATNEY